MHVLRSSDYFRYLRRKQTVITLPTTPEKCHSTTLKNAQLFHLTEGMLHSSKRWWLWKKPVVGWHWWLWIEPVVMCGKWNVRQATLQQMSKVTTFCTDTYFQYFSRLINCIVHHAVPKFSPCRSASATRSYRGLVINTCEKIKKMKNLCILHGSAVTFFGCGGKGVTVCFLLI